MSAAKCCALSRNGERAMSRIGKAPVVLPQKVEVTITPGEISVKGPLGSTVIITLGPCRTFSANSGERISCELDGRGTM